MSTCILEPAHIVFEHSMYEHAVEGSMRSMRLKRSLVSNNFLQSLQTTHTKHAKYVFFFERRNSAYRASVPPELNGKSEPFTKI